MSKVVELLRDKACYYLDHTCETIDKSLIHVREANRYLSPRSTSISTRLSSGHTP